MEPTDANTVKQLLRELGRELADTQSLEIGGSIALLWAGLLSRHTQDVAFVDQVPPTVRLAARSRQIEQRYGLTLASFQSHYLPDRWRARLRDRGMFGKLRVLLVDPLDVMTSKLFSRRTRDLDDLRVITGRWPEERLAAWRDHVLAHAHSLRGDPEGERNARENWEILFGQNLFA